VPDARYHHAGQPRLGASGVEAVSYEYTVSLCGPRRGGAVCWHPDMVCLARTGTCAFPHEVDLSDKTVLERYSHNWGNLSGAALQKEFAARREALRDAAPDQSGRVMQIDPNRFGPVCIGPLVSALVSKHDEPHSNLAYNFNLRLFKAAWPQSRRFQIATFPWSSCAWW